MASFPRSGLFGFLLLLAALDPTSASLATGLNASRTAAAPAQSLNSVQADAADNSIEARLRRITAALQQQDAAQAAEAGQPGPRDQDLAWIGWGNGGFGFRNGFGNGGFRNGGWGNGGFGNGGWRNGGWGNGGFINRW
jgi:rSAM-associated Gly-rich repeat protein